MTDRTLARRTLSRWIVALALVPLVVSVTLPGIAALRPATPVPSATSPSSTPTPAEPNGRALFLPLDGSEDQGVVLSSRGGYVQPPVEPSPTVTPEPSATPAPATDPVEDPTLGADLFSDLLLAVLPADKVDALPDYFLPDDAVLYVKSDFLNLRDGPGTDRTVLHKLGYAEKVTRTAIGMDWSLVATADGKTGYVATKYLSSTKPAPKVPPVSAADQLRAKIVAYAKLQLGIKYVLNHASPTDGFDCSGLVWYVYKHYGISVPRSSYPYATFGKAVKLSEIKPGDVICWDLLHDGITRVDHVGIYVGNGMMIHAAGGGKDVRYQKVSTYSLTFVSVRRIIQ
jgi:cell wall-associated NlpC family hydrolase